MILFFLSLNFSVPLDIPDWITKCFKNCALFKTRFKRQWISNSCWVFWINLPSHRTNWEGQKTHLAGVLVFLHSSSWDHVLRPSGLPKVRRCKESGFDRELSSSIDWWSCWSSQVLQTMHSVIWKSGVATGSGEGGISPSSVFLIPAFPSLLVPVKPFTPLRASCFLKFCQCFW